MPDLKISFPMLRTDLVAVLHQKGQAQLNSVDVRVDGLLKGNQAAEMVEGCKDLVSTVKEVKELRLVHCVDEGRGFLAWGILLESWTYGLQVLAIYTPHRKFTAPLQDYDGIFRALSQAKQLEKFVLSNMSSFGVEGTQMTAAEAHSWVVESFYTALSQLDSLSHVEISLEAMSPSLGLSSKIAELCQLTSTNGSARPGLSLSLEGPFDSEFPDDSRPGFSPMRLSRDLVGKMCGESSRLVSLTLTPLAIDNMDDCAFGLGDGLRHNRTLRTLHIVELNADGALIVTKALKDNPNFEGLYLQIDENNNATTTKLWTDAILQLSSLKRLSLHLEHLGPDETYDSQTVFKGFLECLALDELEDLSLTLEYGRDYLERNPPRWAPYHYRVNKEFLTMWSITSKSLQECYLRICKHDY